MSELNKNQLTLKEASAFSGKDYSTIYRSVKKGKLPCKKIISNDEEITVVDRQDLIRVFKLSVSEENSASQSTQAPEQSAKTENYLTKENLKETFNEFLSEQHAQLMKPLEDQALFVAGKLTQENQFLKEKIETLLHELDKYKALPGPVDQVMDKIKEKETALTEAQNLLESEKSTRKNLEEEKEKLLEEIQIKTRESYELKKQIEILPCPPEAVNKIISEHTENLRSLQKEKDELELRIKDREEEKERLRQQIEKEKNELDILVKQREEEKEKFRQQADREKTELENLVKQREEEKEKFRQQIEKEKHDLELRIKQQEEEKERFMQQAEKEKNELEANIKAKAEEEKKQIAEAWKKEVELAKRPWWKFW